VLPWRVKLCDPHGVFIQRNSDVLHDVGIDSTQGFAGATSKVWIEWRQGVTATDSGRAAVGCVGRLVYHWARTQRMLTGSFLYHIAFSNLG